MEKKILRLFLAIFVLFIGSVSANAQVKKTYTGNWNFTAPTAPEEYMSGVIELKSDSVIMTFTNNPYKYPSNWIKVRNDSLIFETNIDYESVLFSLKLDKARITGKAVWSDGYTQMILTKKESKD